MGMYTKISVDLKFKENLPPEVVEALKAMVGEVELFSDFVKDYVEDGFLGYSLYEEDDKPTLYF